MRRPQEYPFDALLGGLVEALHGARRSTGDQQWRQMLAMMQEGRRIVGPVGAGVSVSNLRAFQQVRIRDLAIEFDCMLRPCPGTTALRLRMRSPGRWSWPRQELHRLRIELVDGPPLRCEVSIDGHGFKHFCFDG